MSTDLESQIVPRVAPVRSLRADSRIARWFPAVGWIVVYFFLAIFPLLLLLVGSLPKGGGYWWDFAMGLGFGGLAMMGLQFVLTARFRRAVAPFGIDIIYYFHRWAAIGGLALLATHYLILRGRYAAALGPLNPLVAPWYMTSGRVSLALFVVLIATSLWRKKLRIGYDGWRVWHGIMAASAVALAIVHITGVGHYTRAVGKGRMWVAYSVLWLFVLGYIRVLRPLRLLRKPYHVVEIREERGSSWTLKLQPERLPALGFRPGQFAWLSLGTSPFRAKEHPFSIAGSAADSKSLHFTIKELGDFTRTIKNIKIGSIAYVDGPYGVFTTDFHAGAPGFVLIAGGVGIAPIMSILRTLADRRDPRPIDLIYGNWRWDGVLFREELDELKLRLRLNVVHVLREPPPEWRGDKGFITEAVLRRGLSSEPRSSVYFLCGPKPMTDFVLPSLRQMKVPLHRIHFEHFEMA